MVYSVTWKRLLHFITCKIEDQLQLQKMQLSFITCQSWKFLWVWYEIGRVDPMLMCHCYTSFVMKWIPGFNKNIIQDSILVDQTLYMPSDSGAGWGPEGRKGKFHIQDMYLFQSKLITAPSNVTCYQMAGWSPGRMAGYLGLSVNLTWWQIGQREK